jgi:hypothetical protein
MINICTQVEINAAQQVVWEILVQSETQKQGDDQPNVSTNGLVLRKGEIVKWEDGRVLALEARGSSNNHTTIEYILQPLGIEQTLVQMSLSLESGVGWMESIVYRITKRFIQREVRQISAELKRKVEYRAFQGQTLAPSTLMMSAVQIIDCGTLTTSNG